MNAKMNAEDSLSTVRRILGLAMILTGIIGTVAQFANWAIWSTRRTGKAMERRVCSAITDLFTPAL